MKFSLDQKAIISGLVLLICQQCCVRANGTPVKVAQLTSWDGRKCYQTDLAYLAESSVVFDIRKGFEVSHVGANVIGRYFEEFILSDHIEDIMILTPANRTKSTCYRFAACRATIILVNQRLSVGKSGNCFDVLHGHYYHTREEEVTDFEIHNIVPYRITCNYSNVNALAHYGAMHSSLNDIWSPVEDIANEAVEQMKTVGAQFTDQINEQVDQTQKMITAQVNQVSVAVQENANVVLQTVTTGFQSLEQKLDKVIDTIGRDVSTVGYYVHIVIHITQFLGTIVLLIILYKIYKKATGVYNLFHWIWSRIHPHPHPQPQQHQAPPQPRQ